MMWLLTGCKQSAHNPVRFLLTKENPNMQALSPTDSAFLWMETRNQPMHVAGLNIYTPPSGRGPDFVAKLHGRVGQTA
jgi:hypothetical protein